jgi:hypothetical protein
MQTIWLSPTNYTSGDPSLDLSYPYVSHPSTIVTSKTVGDEIHRQSPSARPLPIEGPPKNKLWSHWLTNVDFPTPARATMVTAFTS